MDGGIESGWEERQNQDGWRDRIMMGVEIESGWEERQNQDGRRDRIRMGGEIESGWVERQNQNGRRDRIRMGGGMLLIIHRAKMDENRRKKNLNNIFKHLNYLDI